MRALASISGSSRCFGVGKQTRARVAGGGILFREGEGGGDDALVSFPPLLVRFGRGGGGHGTPRTTAHTGPTQNHHGTTNKPETPRNPHRTHTGTATEPPRNPHGTHPEPTRNAHGADTGTPQEIPRFWF